MLVAKASEGQSDSAEKAVEQPVAVVQKKK